VSHIQENLLGAHLVRLYHRQTGEENRFAQKNEQCFKAAIKQAKVRLLLLPLMRLIVGLALALILFIGGRAIILGSISVGDFVEINARILQLTWPAISIGFVMSMYSRGKASIERVNKLLTYKPSIVDGPIILSDLRQVEVRNLILNPSQQQSSLSFSLSPGQTLGIVGTSGSFKSSLLTALYRRREIPKGCIFYNGHDINDLTLISIYQHVGVVTQEPSVFNRSIRDNLTFANPKASLHEVEKVLHLTRLDRDIRQLADGIDTIVGERGVMLSGGQRQRLALARTLLKKPPLLILDDVLSAVDAETQQHILNGIWEFLGDIMVIIASHQLALVKKASRIVVLDKGQLVADGSYDYLYQSSQLFRELGGFDTESSS
jgi:ATP-binding cassette subfamily B multidrug efflux pump